MKRLTNGFKRMWFREHPESENIKVPFTPEMALVALVLLEVRVDLLEIEKDRIFTAMVVGIAFLLRKSEHIGNKIGTAPPLRKKDVVFFDRDDRVIPYHLVGGTTRAERVAINIKFSKADQTGLGRINSHVRQTDEAKFCVVRVLEKWIYDTRVFYGAKEGDLLYHLKIRGAEKFDIDLLHEVMTETTDSMIQDRSKKRVVNEEMKRVTSHSLRYGGAVAMAAAGLPEYFISLYGGWKEGSPTVKHYIRMASLEVSRVSGAMAVAATSLPSSNFIRRFVIQKKTK